MFEVIYLRELLPSRHAPQVLLPASKPERPRVSDTVFYHSHLFKPQVKKKVPL